MYKHAPLRPDQSIRWGLAQDRYIEVTMDKYKFPCIYVHKAITTDKFFLLFKEGKPYGRIDDLIIPRRNSADLDEKWPLDVFTAASVGVKWHEHTFWINHKAAKIEAMVQAAYIVSTTTQLKEWSRGIDVSGSSK